jgi:hypothetical protein
MNFDWQMLLAAVLIGLMVIKVFRDGQAEGQHNPIGTAKVQSDVTDLGARLGRVESAVARIEKDVEKAPSAADFERLRGDIKAHAAITEGVKGHVESVDSAVVRIEMMLNNLTPAPRPSSRRAK